MNIEKKLQSSESSNILEKDKYNNTNHTKEKQKESTNLYLLARHYATVQHRGQFRKKSNLPYIIHPIAVAENAVKYGLADDNHVCIALLHDTIEDTSTTYEELKNIFNKKIADGVFYLTKETTNKAYKQKLSTAPDDIKLIKLCDVLDNVKTLENLESEGIERKINDYYDFFKPIADEICPAISVAIGHYIENYIIENDYKI